MNDLNKNNLIEDIESVISEKQKTPLIIPHIKLHDDTWVNERFYNQVLQLIREIEPALEQEQGYTAEILCGEAFWESLKKGERIRAGKCVVDMVQKNLLPLRFAGTTKANSRLYELK